MPKKTYKSYIILFFALSILLAGVLGAGLVLAVNPQGTAGNTPHTTSATPAVAHMLSKHVAQMSSVPAVSPSSKQPAPNSGPENERPAGIEQLKEMAAHNPKAPVAPAAYSTTKNMLAAGIQTPSLTTGFQGMANSSTICPPRGCAAPDQALAASPNWVLEGVNTSFAVYSPTGALQAGWPKNAQNFFGVPNPPNNCATVPYLIDVRAFYDPNDGRFWAAILQDENALGSFGDNCPFQALYWIAVSQSSNPNGAWNVYSFDMSNGTTNGVDFTEFGFDAQAVYLTGNMFNQSGSTFQYAEVFAVSKALMESGASVTAHGFFNLQLNGVPVDSVQPVETEAHSYSGPNVGLFINSLNYKFGNTSCSSGCQGLVVWALANPTSTSPSITSAFLTTTTYTLAPYADEPGCTHCIDTDETQILGTPIYHNGLISFALNTGVNNGTQVVPGIFWGQVSPVLNEDTATITSASVWQSGYFDYSGDTAACYGALMPDNDGNLFMVFNRTSSSINPEVDYVSRRVTFSAGLFHDAGATLRVGDARFSAANLWGDFNATSYDGPSTDNVWFAGEYSSASGDWSTYIGESRLTLTNPSPTPTPTPTSTATPTPTPTPPSGGITLRATAAGNNGAGGSTLTISLPAGTTSGDVMVAHVVVRNAGNTITPPAGWSLVLRQDSTSSISTASYVKVAGTSEPANYTWSFGTSGQASGGIASYIGVNTTTPVDASHAQYNPSSSNVDNSGVTTTTANDMLVYAVGITVATTVNVPSGFTQEWSTTSSSMTTSEMSQEIFASVGATGSIHGTHNGGANSNITMLIALKPA